MATIDENLATLDNTKTAFKTKFASADVSTTDVAFTNYPNLLDQMEKILPSQVKNVVPTTSLQSVSADSGKKLIQVNVSGVTSAIDSNIQAGNIKKNVTILGVTGSLEAGTDVSDTTATAGDVLSGKDFHLANGTKTTGTIPTYSGSTTITDNGTLSTSGKYMASDLTINVAGVTPTGTINITENGTYNVTNYASANVNVEGGGTVTTDTSATTAEADDVLSGYDFYDNTGTKQTGTLQTMAGGTYTTNQVLQTAGKVLTSDIVVNVANGSSRLENDTLYSMKAQDIMRVELGEDLYTNLPTDAEYLTEQTYINGVINEIDANVTNFADFALKQCKNALVENLQLKGVMASENMPLETLIAQVFKIGLDGAEQPLAHTGGTGDTTATADKVRTGRLFYGSDGNVTYGTIGGVCGRRIDVNQTISTANKYLTSDIEIYVPSDTNPNETMAEMMAVDLMRYNLGIITSAEIPTLTEYAEQQTYVNNLIYEIMGVQFNG